MELNSLIEAARAARDRAYAPHSRFRVGCVIETGGGRTFEGCNIENASYGLTMCAERVAAGAAVAAGERSFRRIVIVTDDVEPTPPCGACRQVLAEFAADAEVISVAGDRQAHWTVDALLPHAFTLSARAAAGEE